MNKNCFVKPGINKVKIEWELGLRERESERVREIGWGRIREYEPKFEQTPLPEIQITPKSTKP
jgi:hypothetical protein